jgi:hypothetical protein
MNSAPASSRARRLYSTFSKTLLAGRRIDFAPRLDRLRYFGKPSAFTSGASDFRHNIFGLGLFIKIVSEIKKDTQANFTGTRSTRFISLCKIEVVRPSSQLMVTPLQVVSTTVPRSVVVAPQRTRSPTLRSLDWSPVIGVRR